MVPFERQNVLMSPNPLCFLSNLAEKNLFLQATDYMYGKALKYILIESLSLMFKPTFGSRALWITLLITCTIHFFINTQENCTEDWSTCFPEKEVCSAEKKKLCGEIPLKQETRRMYVCRGKPADYHWLHNFELVVLCSRSHKNG